MLRAFFVFPRLFLLSAVLLGCSSRPITGDLDPVAPSDGGRPDGNNVTPPPPPPPPPDAAPPPPPPPPADAGTDGTGTPPTGLCVAEDLGSVLGAHIATGTTTGAGQDQNPTCAPSTSEDVIFAWKAPFAGSFTFDTEGSAFDTVLQLWAENCGETDLGCSDDSSFGSQSRVQINVEADANVVIVIDGFHEDAGTFFLSIMESVASEVDACHDGIDNDRDGVSDCDDFDCSGGEGCSETRCSDGLDDEPDGMIDCADWDCFGAEECRERVCDDGIDDEGDGLIDCEDGDCFGDHACEERNCSDGIDGDADGEVDCDDADCRSNPTCDEAMCSDGVDDDGDGATDCDDSECRCAMGCPGASCPGEDLGSALGASIATGTTAGSCPSRRGSCGGSGREVTYIWTAPAAGLYRIDLVGSVFDTVLYVLDGDCSGGELACDDDTFGLQSSVDVMATTNQRFVIVVDGFSGGVGGRYVLNINPSDGSTPPDEGWDE